MNTNKRAHTDKFTYFVICLPAFFSGCFWYRKVFAVYFSLAISISLNKTNNLCFLYELFFVVWFFFLPLFVRFVLSFVCKFFFSERCIRSMVAWSRKTRRTYFFLSWLMVLCFFLAFCSHIYKNCHWLALGKLPPTLRELKNYSKECNNKIKRNHKHLQNNVALRLPLLPSSASFRHHYQLHTYFKQIIRSILVVLCFIFFVVVGCNSEPRVTQLQFRWIIYFITVSLSLLVLHGFSYILRHAIF